MSEFVLKVKEIDDAEGGKDYSFRLEESWVREALAGSDLRFDPEAALGTFQLHAQRSGSDILVQGTVQTRVLTDCSRCLGDAAVEVATRVVSVLTERGATPPVHEQDDEEEIELSQEDLERDFYSGEHIVLDDIVRQHILLECPMQPLCAEDCAGIDVPEHVRPPVESVDPRLEPLKKVARKLERSEE